MEGGVLDPDALRGNPWAMSGRGFDRGIYEAIYLLAQADITS